MEQDISNKSVQELKSIAYDLIKSQEITMRNLQVVNNRIDMLEKQNVAQNPKDEKVD